MGSRFRGMVERFGDRSAGASLSLNRGARESAIDLLALPTDRPEPVSLDSTYELVDMYRSRFRARMWERPPAGGGRLRAIAHTLVAIGIALGVASLVSVYAITLAEGSGARSTAFVLNGLSSAILAVAVALYGVARLRRRRWRSGLAMTLAGVVVLLLTVLVASRTLPDSWGF
jgi:VIT1/CCC1 family predicted Fe2+/Mn2+ transporter